jgi:hypothetical protein
MDRQLGYLEACLPCRRAASCSADGLEANDAGMRRRTYAVLNRITTKRSRPDHTPAAARVVTDDNRAARQLGP